MPADDAERPALMAKPRFPKPGPRLPEARAAAAPAHRSPGAPDGGRHAAPRAAPGAGRARL